jgi:hypothetical protein
MYRVDFLPQSPLFSEQVNGVFFGGKGYVGMPDTALFRLKNGQQMKQTDFAWSLSEASWISTDTKKAKK